MKTRDRHELLDPAEFAVEGFVAAEGHTVDDLDGMEQTDRVAGHPDLAIRTLSHTTKQRLVRNHRRPGQRSAQPRDHRGSATGRGWDEPWRRCSGLEVAPRPGVRELEGRFEHGDLFFEQLLLLAQSQRVSENRP